MCRLFESGQGHFLFQPLIEKHLYSCVSIMCPRLEMLVGKGLNIRAFPAEAGLELCYDVPGLLERQAVLVCLQGPTDALPLDPNIEPVVAAVFLNHLNENASWSSIRIASTAPFSFKSACGVTP